MELVFKTSRVTAGRQVAPSPNENYIAPDGLGVVGVRLRSAR